jgi:DNA (cytosine-5)-methyltransferase 1
MQNYIPVIDIFAGPGGLGEGFASLIRKQPFRVCLSVEKDPTAYQTLLLRAFYRQFPRASVPRSYYEYLRKEIDRETLFERHEREAESASNEAWHKELCEENHAEVTQRVTKLLGETKAWVLVGGPPCQAYSVMGRSRMKGADPEKYEEDPRHYLYREYLKIIADHRPPIFVMENVKGILSSTVSGQGIFPSILKDLESPFEAIGIDRARSNHGQEGLSYNIYSLVKGESLFNEDKPSDFVIKAEDYGVPQTRHRVILLGIRSDLHLKPNSLANSTLKVTVRDVISDLPKLRSVISRSADSNGEWLAAIQAIRTLPCFGRNGVNLDNGFWSELSDLLNEAGRRSLNIGGEFVSTKRCIKRYKRWYHDSRLGGVCNHSARAHMEEDLRRYFFASCFAKSFEKSPELKDFPKVLLPNHKNVEEALKGELFNDRFRVQLWKKPATTITSHMSKDGHYYIHPDPTQCRSLTVREAARLQTFPDNYFFEGTRSSQYQQVGNAVPPYLARQIAEIVHDALIESGMLQKN